MSVRFPSCLLCNVRATRLQVDKEIADKDGWWYKPEYLFNELNINR